MWHNGITFKLTQNSISGNLLNLLHNFLQEGKQGLVLKKHLGVLLEPELKFDEYLKMVSLHVMKTI